MTMKKLFIYLFIMTAGLLSATQVSAQKEMAHPKFLGGNYL